MNADELWDIASAIVAEHGYIRVKMLLHNAKVSQPTACNWLRRWAREGRLKLHGGRGGRGGLNHYTLPGEAPILGREARWLRVVKPRLLPKGRFTVTDYSKECADVLGPVTQGSLSTDLGLWVQEGRLERTGGGALYVYSRPGDPLPPPPSRERTTKVDRWTIVKAAVIDQGHVTHAAIAREKDLSYSALENDLAAWVLFLSIENKAICWPKTRPL